MDLVNSFKSTSVKYFTVTFIIFTTERYSYSRMILDYASDHQNVFDPSHNKVLTMDAMGLGNSRALTLQIITIRYPFLESPENFSGPKSHSYNCNPFFPVKQVFSYQVFVKVIKIKITAKFRASRSLRFEESYVSRNAPEKFRIRDYQETGPRPL